jgi:hypothetical protein
MGSASDGPLLACTEQQFRLLEIDGFTALELPDDERGQPIGQLANNNYWAGGAGRVFGRSGRLGMPNGVSTLVLDADRAKLTYQHEATFYVVPGPDGKHIWSGGHGALTIDVGIAPDVVYSSMNNGNASHLYLPAHHGPYYFHLNPEHGVTIHVLGDKQPLAVLKDIGNPTFGEMQTMKGFPMEQTVHLIAQAKLLVVVPVSRDSLTLVPIDLKKAG